MFNQEMKLDVLGAIVDDHAGATDQEHVDVLPEIQAYMLKYKHTCFTICTTKSN